MTAKEMLQVAGLVVATLFARGALVVAFVMVLSVPLMAYAYAARAVQGTWHRHHLPRHARRNRIEPADRGVALRLCRQDRPRHFLLIDEAAEIARIGRQRRVGGGGSPPRRRPPHERPRRHRRRGRGGPRRALAWGMLWTWPPISTALYPLGRSPESNSG